MVNEVVEQKSMPTEWFDKHIALQVVRHWFKQGKDRIRIAVGFFSVRGYDLIRASANSKKLFILVGKGEWGEEKVTQALIKDIMRDLGEGRYPDRRQAVEDLVTKMEHGKFHIVDAKAMDHHGKLYIVDDLVALIASSNLTKNGLIENIEIGKADLNKESVAHFITWYDDYFNSPACQDLTAELLQKLKAWLGLYDPWWVYLKTLEALQDLEDVGEKRMTYRKPVNYQRAIVARALRQIREHRGAMVVASTGLGKTVIAADIARRLQRSDEIDNVLVIGPKPVEKSWDDHLRERGVCFEYFNHHALDTSHPSSNRRVIDLEDIFSRMDERWLIVLDESHYLRKLEVWKIVRYETDDSGKKRPVREKVERLAFTRLLQAIEKSKCKVLLLTGTPYATKLDDINCQLLLLPHTMPDSFPGYDMPWEITKPEQLKTLRVGSVLTTPHVAQKYGKRDELGVYIDYGDERKYIPKMFLHRVIFPVILEREIASALNKDCFKVVFPGSTSSTALLEIKLRQAWASSPWALCDVITKSLKYRYAPSIEDAEDIENEDAYDLEFAISVEDRRRVLSPILKQLERFDPCSDTFSACSDTLSDKKLKLLCELLDQQCADGGQVVIFVERWPTVCYLEKALSVLRPFLRIASTIDYKGPGRYRDKETWEKDELISDFAPEANRKTDQPIGQRKYDVFITTDAYGVGVNMQDAHTVISYDQAWTAIEPAQRAGRILRLFVPREVHLYVFTPNLTPDDECNRKVKLINLRWDTLIIRHNQSVKVTVLPTLTQYTDERIDVTTLLQSESVSLQDESLLQRHAFQNESVSLQDDIGEEIDLERVEDVEVTPILQDMSDLENNRERLKDIPDDITSAKRYDGKRPLLYMLIRHKDEPHLVVYDIMKKVLALADENQVVDMLKCDEKTRPAAVDASDIERYADDCLQAWCEQHGVEDMQVSRICTLYLKPQRQDDSLEEILA